MQVASVLERTLAEDGEGRTVAQLVAAVRRAGHARVPRTAVERVLAADARFHAEEVLGRTVWRLVDAADDARGAGDGRTGTSTRAPIHTPPDGRQRLADLALRDWQVAALADWSATCRGVVEAVTGTGKTRLALAAIAVVLGRGGRALVLVPTLELQEQWLAELRAAVPDARLGRLGGGHADDLHEREVVVATPHSAASVPLDLPAGTPGLLVADEAHRYGSATWAAALSDAFDLRLALTATYERGDDGVQDVLRPYFGEVVHRYALDRAVADGAVAPFRMALVGVPLEAREAERHEQLDLRVRRAHRQLVGALDLPREPRARFAAVAAIVAEAERTGRDGPQAAACREYLALVRQRREVAAQATGKLALCAHVAPALTGRRTLVFADTVEQADAAARTLAGAGLRTRTIHGEVRTDHRRARMRAFRDGRLDVLVAPRVLDEGVDVPDADVALVLAAFRTRRQLVQRLGRVLRVKPDGRHADLVLAHAEETAEDPARGGHREFLDLARPVAREVVALGAVHGDDALAGWLTGANDGATVR